MKSNRDDFTKRVIRTLREQVSYRCSNPECRIVTAAPGTNKEGVNRVGQAAHITAASPEGPRYNSQMTSEERASADNGIWLCNICAKKIDNSDEEYSVELLRDWKSKALEKAKKELGKSLPDEDYAVNLLATAISGSSSGNIARQAIPNVHSATEASLSKRYPGYKFETSYLGGKTSLSINPEPGKNIKLAFNASNPRDAYREYTSLIKTGKPAHFEVNNIKIDGPDIIKPENTDENAFVSVGLTNAKDSVLKIVPVNEEDKEFPFDDILGNCHVGSEAVYFEGQAYGGLINTSIVVSDNDDLCEPLTIKFNYAVWNDVKLRSLPYINKIDSFLKNLRSSKKVVAKIEVEGEDFFSGVANPNNFVDKNIELIGLLSKAREICIELEQDITFTPESILESDAIIIENLYRNLEFQRNIALEQEKSLEINFTAEVKKIDEFNSLVNQPAAEIRIDEHKYKDLKIFNQSLELPPLVQFFRSVKASIVREIEKDRLYEVKLEPLIGFEFWEGFDIKRNKKKIKKVCE